ncbi:MAG: hypothetical protein NTY53_14100 [Kiritimatiellaeota bacterium]|nr:hypothetical protein [Kiritimatiellota bacterium]
MDWKTKPTLFPAIGKVKASAFQALEKTVRKFPRTGKENRRFSRAWKIEQNPKPQGAELSATTAEPSATTAEPSAMTAGRSAITAEPSAMIAGPSALTAEPSATMAEPSAMIAELSATTAERPALTAESAKTVKNAGKQRKQEKTIPFGPAVPHTASKPSHALYGSLAQPFRALDPARPTRQRGLTLPCGSKECARGYPLSWRGTARLFSGPDYDCINAKKTKDRERGSENVHAKIVSWIGRRVGSSVCWLWHLSATGYSLQPTGARFSKRIW